jgi:hypothetical protein
MAHLFASAAAALCTATDTSSRCLPTSDNTGMDLHEDDASCNPSIWSCFH